MKLKLALAQGLAEYAVGRYPAEAEAAVYFCCLEALQNAVKHAQAARMVITVSE